MGLSHRHAARLLRMVDEEGGHSSACIPIKVVALHAAVPCGVHVHLAVVLSRRDRAVDHPRSSHANAHIRDDSHELLGNISWRPHGDSVSVRLRIHDGVFAWFKGLLHIRLSLWWILCAA